MKPTSLRARGHNAARAARSAATPPPPPPAQGARPGDLPLARFSRPGVPKYVALRDAMVHAITTGLWAAGERLPNESALADALPLSLGTIQRALRMLVDDGVIVRRPGAGSFVARTSPGAMRAPLHCRFVGDDGEYLPVYPRIIGRSAVKAGPWSRLTGHDTVCIERALRIGDEFTVFSRFYFDPTRLPALASIGPSELAGANFKDVILRESGLAIGRIVQYVSTVRLPADIAHAIGARPGTAMRLDIEAYGGREVPLYYQTLWIPRNSRRLQLPGDGRETPVAVNGAAVTQRRDAP